MPKGYKMTDEQRAKQLAAWTPEKRAEASARALAAMTPEKREHLSRIVKASMTPERRLQCGNGKRGKPLTAEHCSKIGAARRGKRIGPFTDEHRARISAAARNRSGSKGGATAATEHVWLRMPDHPNANKNGYIRRARIVMERCIGRLLTAQEIVHHIDGDCKNDCAENLQLFASQSDHARAHALQSPCPRNPKGQWAPGRTVVSLQ